ncbi:hypothetical protein D3C72_2258730 [compost metagenome]
MDDAQQRLAIGHSERRTTRARDKVDRRVEFGGRLAPVETDKLEHRIHGALADFAAIDVDAGNARLRGERDWPPLPHCRFSQAIFRLGERHD